MSFYGGGSIAADGALLGRIAAPVLAFWGAHDVFIPRERVERIEATMRQLGKTYEATVYPGAVHGFFCEERAAFHPDAATDAWTKLLEWLSKYMNRRSSSK